MKQSNGKPENRKTGKPENRKTGIIIDDAPDNNKTARKNNVIRTGIASGSHKVVQRYGSANAEYIKGYRGINNETGQVFNKSLRGIAKGKIHPNYAEQNIKQQAGYSAEVAATSRDKIKATIIRKYSACTGYNPDIIWHGKKNNAAAPIFFCQPQRIENKQEAMTPCQFHLAPDFIPVANAAISGYSHHPATVLPWYPGSRLADDAQDAAVTSVPM